MNVVINLFDLVHQHTARDARNALAHDDGLDCAVTRYHGARTAFLTCLDTEPLHHGIGRNARRRKLDAHAAGFKILHEREDHALVLVVLREAQRAEVRQTVDVVDVAAEIALHLQRARPALEGEHRLPVQPEVRAPEALGQHLGDLLVL